MSRPAPTIRPQFDLARRDKRCYCGCGDAVAGRIRFRPGHDARLVSQQVKALVVDGGYTGDIQAAIDFRTGEIEAATSPALAAKFYNACLVAWAKMNATPRTQRSAVSAAKASRSLVGRPVKIRIGRWTYDGHVSSVPDDKDRKTRHSEVCAITYTDSKGREHTVDVDGDQYHYQWEFVTTDASHLKEDK